MRDPRVPGPALPPRTSDYTPPRTPWPADPDLRGHYLPGTSQPLETPRHEPWGDTQYTGHNYTFTRFFRPEGDAPARPRERTRTPMIIDPPDGRVPLQEWAAERREEIMDRQEELAFLDPRVKCLPAALRAAPHCRSATTPIRSSRFPLHMPLTRTLRLTHNTTSNGD